MANNQNNEAANAVTMAGLFGVFLIAGFGLLLVVAAAFLTLVSICAQFKPVKLKGETITAKEGRAFILNGFIGAFIAAAIVPASATAMGFDPTRDWVPYVLIAGYSLGSIGITLLVQTFWGEEKTETAALPPPATVEDYFPAERKKPYEFTSWDDEDADPYK